MTPNKKNILIGLVVYPIGDGLAAFISNDFTLSRFFAMAALGASFYAYEIPRVFAWIEKKATFNSKIKNELFKTSLSTLYFNPLWIFRHFFVIQLSLNSDYKLSWDLLQLAYYSFLGSIPIAFFGNYAIQNWVSLKKRFLISSLFSGFMAIYYALSAVYFS